MPVQRLNATVRAEIHRRVLAAVRESIAHEGAPDDTTPLAGRCLEFAWQGYQLLRTWPGAPRTIIQAGSAQWPRIPREFDDGVTPTHFGYQWDPECEHARLACSGVVPASTNPDGSSSVGLPEMHVWLACPDTQEVLDFSTGCWPEACRIALGLGWPGREPPEYFWHFATRLPEGVHYVPDRDAIDCVVGLLRLFGRSYP